MSDNLTAKEIEVLGTIGNSEYHDELEGQVWSNCVVENRAGAAVVGSLAKKGLCVSYGSGREATVELTDAGCLAFVEHFPTAELAVDYRERKGLDAPKSPGDEWSNLRAEIERLRAQVGDLNAALTQATRETIEANRRANDATAKLRRIADALAS